MPGPGSPAAVEVSVIVPVRNARSQLPECLDALRSQQSVRFEVIVVDNSSTDDTAALARAHPVGPTVLTEAVPGSYAARNTGAAAAAGPVLAFTDADCRPAPRWLAAGLTALRDADLVGGRIEMVRRDDAGRWERYDRAMYLRQDELVVRDGFAATANLFVTTDVMRRVGGFDPGLRSSGDLEWSRRAVSLGMRLGYAPEAVVLHLPRTTAADTWRLHRRLGAGWRALAARGQWPGVVGDPALWLPLGRVVELVAADGPPLRRRQLGPVHALATLARVTGRVTGRG